MNKVALAECPEHRERILRLRAETKSLRRENERLRAALLEAQEIYAGMEGFVTETAPEAYLQQQLALMYGVIANALKGETE